MLVCGQVNPPPIGNGYNGVYFSENDDLSGKANSLKGTPLRVEHNDKTHVGQVIQGWTDSRGAMWALAEIDTSNLSGALTAAAVEHGRLGEFSLGYVAKMQKDKFTGKIEVQDKRIIELSIVKKGAREGCTIQAKEGGPASRSIIQKKKYNRD
jgi:hypothetical protein